MVTSHMEYAPKGYRVEAFRYLDKWKLEEEIEEALCYVERIWIQKREVCIPLVNQEPLRISCEDIIYMDTEKRHLRIHTKKGEYISGEKLSDMEMRLKDHGFYNIHRSILVNLEWVKEVYKSELIMKNGEKLLISTRRKKDVTSALYRWRFEQAYQ